MFCFLITFEYTVISNIKNASEIHYSAPRGSCDLLSSNRGPFCMRIKQEKGRKNLHDQVRIRIWKRCVISLVMPHLSTIRKYKNPCTGSCIKICKIHLNWGVIGSFNVGRKYTPKNHAKLMKQGLRVVLKVHARKQVLMYYVAGNVLVLRTCP